MKKKGRTVLYFSVVILGAAVALARKKSPKPEQLGEELGKAPDRASSWQNPYAGQADAFLAGKKLFKQHCAACHGADGRGRDKAPDLNSPVIQDASPGVLFWLLRNGNLKEGMPSWSRLPDQRLWQIVTYLKTLRGESGGSSASRFREKAR